MSLAIDSLLSPVNLDAPCGDFSEDNTSLYSDFSALEQAAKGKPEQVMGDSVIPAVEPDWRSVYELSLELLKKTKDLKVACYLTQSLIMRQGFEGVRDGLLVIEGLLKEYWQDVHPQLTIDDDYDPDYRVNAVAYLADADFIKSLAKIKLVASKAVGQFTLIDYRLAISGDDKPEGAPDISLINAAFMDVDLESLKSVQDAVGSAISSVESITQIFDEKLTDASGPQLAPLLAELKYVLKVYGEFLSDRGVDAEDGALEEGGEDAEQTMTEESTAVVVKTNPGEVNSREDVIKQIDKICTYYVKNEPSSPVPLILNRAKKLVSMDFMDIMKDMSPESVKAIMSLAGMEEGSN
jgi:type VI secretion system protein ImpA